VKKRKERREVSLKKTKRPRYKKDASKVRCYNCKKLGHYAFQCPHKNEKGNRKHHAHATDTEEPTSKKAKESKDEEYVFVSALTGTITQGSDIWLMDSGASKHMTGFRSSLTNLQRRVHPFKWSLGMIPDTQSKE
jgi:hypothetical protein